MVEIKMKSFFATMLLLLATVNTVYARDSSHHDPYVITGADTVERRSAVEARRRLQTPRALSAAVDPADSLWEAWSSRHEFKNNRKLWDSQRTLTRMKVSWLNDEYFPLSLDPPHLLTRR